MAFPRPLVFSLIGLLWVGASFLYATGRPTQTQDELVLDRPAALQRAFVDKYCLTCHNDKLRTGNLTLEMPGVGRVDVGNTDLWEKVVRKLRTGAMPPAGVRRPEKAAANAFIASLETSLDQVSVAHPNPGRAMTLHRLNRTEYHNAVRDLFGVQLNAEDASLLPPDDSSFGFDNIADVLGLPPLLLERYLSIARRVSQAALGPVKSSDVNIYTHHVPFGLSQREWLEGLPFGTRGGAVFTHQFPVDGEYSIKIRLQRNADAIIGLTRQLDEDGLPQRQRIEIGLDGSPVALFTIGYDKTVRESVLATPQELDRAEEPVKELTPEEQTEQSVRGDAALEERVFVKAGARRISATFLARFVPVANQIREPYPTGTGAPPRPMGIDSVIISGPYKTSGKDTPSRRRLFVCRPSSVVDEQTCARTILRTLAHRAYRRPVSGVELQTLLNIYTEGRREGNFETGIDLALRRLLVDPAFLFRAERDPGRIAPNTPYRITDLELASRLSFFLWSSIPDDELLSAAERGLLKDPVVLEHQVRRMLADQRAQSLVTNFATQWLSLRALAGVQPDPIIFPDFDESLRQAFQRETELLLEAVLRGDRSVLELIDANYTFVNERLARHYGIPGVYGDQFRRVSVTDGARGGLLGQGSILTVTALPNRTSPVLRGKWILENILGSPPPPPPPDVPPLPEGADNGKVLTMRERLSEHRKNPACASCHARMDPLGFALENFDAIGKWRTVESAGPTDMSRNAIDASGQLMDGTKFDGAAGLRHALEPYYGEFVYTITERLLTYGLGRGVELSDAPAIRRIVRDARPDGYHFSSLVLGITKSVPFQMRLSRDMEDSQAQSSQRLKTGGGR